MGMGNNMNTSGGIIMGSAVTAIKNQGKRNKAVMAALAALCVAAFVAFGTGSFASAASAPRPALGTQDPNMIYTRDGDNPGYYKSVTDSEVKDYLDLEGTEQYDDNGDTTGVGDEEAFWTNDTKTEADIVIAYKKPIKPALMLTGMCYEHGLDAGKLQTQVNTITASMDLALYVEAVDYLGATYKGKVVTDTNNNRPAAMHSGQLDLIAGDTLELRRPSGRSGILQIKHEGTATDIHPASSNTTTNPGRLVFGIISGAGTSTSGAHSNIIAYANDIVEYFDAHSDPLEQPDFIVISFDAWAWATGSAAIETGGGQGEGWKQDAKVMRQAAEILKPYYERNAVLLLTPDGEFKNGNDYAAMRLSDREAMAAFLYPDSVQDFMTPPSSAGITSTMTATQIVNYNMTNPNPSQVMHDYGSVQRKTSDGIIREQADGVNYFLASKRLAFYQFALLAPDLYLDPSVVDDQGVPLRIPTFDEWYEETSQHKNASYATDVSRDIQELITAYNRLEITDTVVERLEIKEDEIQVFYNAGTDEEPDWQLVPLEYGDDKTDGYEINIDGQKVTCVINNLDVIGHEVRLRIPVKTREGDGSFYRGKPENAEKRETNEGDVIVKRINTEIENKVFKEYTIETPYLRKNPVVEVAAAKEWKDDYDNSFNTREDILLHVDRTPQGGQQTKDILPAQKIEKENDSRAVTVTWGKLWDEGYTAGDGTEVSAEDNVLYGYDEDGRPYTYSIRETNTTPDEGELVAYTPTPIEWEAAADDGTPVQWEEEPYDMGYRHDPEDFVNTFKTTDIEVTKVWVDHRDDHEISDLDGLFKLYGLWNENNAEATTVGTYTYPDPTITKVSDSVFTIKWAELPEYRGTGAGAPTKITYNVTEPDAVDGYADPVYEGEELEVDGNTSIKTGGTITNTQLIKINVVKVWEDDNNRDGSRNDATIKVVLTQNGDTYATPATLSEPQEGDESASKSADGNTWTWESVWLEAPYADESGDPYEYAAEETDKPDGYKAEPDNSQVLTDWKDDETLVFTVTNTYKPKKVSITAEKLWNDVSDQDGKRADNNATFQLYKQVGTGEPEPVGDPVDVTTWVRPTNEGEVHTWDDLFAFEDGERITYSVVEVTDGLADGYTLDGYEGGDGADGNEVVYNDDDAEEGVMSATVKATNSYTPKTASVKVIKAWDDNNNQDGKRTDSISFTLTGSDNSSRPYTITNINTEADDNDSSGEYTWVELPVYAAGEKITYTLVEDETVEGYEDPSYSKQNEGFTLDADQVYEVTVTNTHAPEKVALEITKIWDDAEYFEGEAADLENNAYERPAITVVLTASAGEWEETQEIKLTEQDLAEGTTNTWKTTVEDLDKYHAGTEISYTIKEEQPQGFVTPSGGSLTLEETTYKGELTNTPEKEEETEELTLTIIKTDETTGDPLAGAVFTVTKDGEEVGTTEETAEDGTTTFTFREPGTYTISETAPTGYTAAEDVEVTVDKELTSITLKDPNTEHPSGFFEWLYELIFGEPQTALDSNEITFVNTPKTTKVKVEKVWEDVSDQDGVRPENIEVVVSASATGWDGDSDTLTLEGEGNTWAAESKDFPSYVNGEKVTFTVAEPELPEGYTAEVEEVEELSDGTYSATITNTYTPKTVDISIDKVWNDSNDQDGKRANNKGAIVTLQKKTTGDWQDVETANVPLEDDQIASWTDLPAFENGERITYRVSESGLASMYTAAYTGGTGSANNEFAYSGAAAKASAAMTVTNTCDYDADPPTDTGETFKGRYTSNGSDQSQDWTPSDWISEIKTYATQPDGSPNEIDGFTLVDANGNEVTTLTTDEGTYVIDPQTGKVTFTPAPGFTQGKASTVTVRAKDKVGAITGKYPQATYTPEVVDNKQEATAVRNITYTYLTADGTEASKTVQQTVKLVRYGTVDEIAKTVSYEGASWQPADDANKDFPAQTSPAIEGWKASGNAAGQTPNPSTDVQVVYDEVTNTFVYPDLHVLYVPQNAGTDERTTTDGKFTSVGGLQEQKSGSFTNLTDKLTTKTLPDGSANTITGYALIDPETGEEVPGGTLVIEGEGTYTIDPATGEVTFVPDKDFPGGAATRVEVRAKDKLSAVLDETVATLQGRISNIDEELADIDEQLAALDEAADGYEEQKAALEAQKTALAEEQATARAQVEEYSNYQVPLGFYTPNVVLNAETATPSRTITYTYYTVDGDQVQENVVQTLEFTRYGTYNPETGEVEYDSSTWIAKDGKDTFDAVNSPIMEATGGTGWHTDTEVVPALRVTDPTKPIEDEHVVYTPTGGTAVEDYWVTYIDPATGRVIQEKIYQPKTTAEPPAPADPTRDGYTFDGWDREVDADGNITYKAKWVPVSTPEPPAPINWVRYIDSDGSTVYLPQTDWTIGTTEPAAPEDPTKDGYVFDGWDRTVDEDGNVTYIAKWKPAITPEPEPEPEPQPSPTPTPSPSPQPSVRTTPVPTSTSASGVAVQATPKTADSAPYVPAAVVLMASAAAMALSCRRLQEACLAPAASAAARAGKPARKEQVANSRQ